MNKVFITKATFKKLVKEYTIDDYKCKKLPYYEKLRHILSIPEQNLLGKYSAFLEDIESIHKYKKLKKPRPSDPKKRIIYNKNNSPSFHFYEECEYLKSDYENYDIPVEIPEERIEEYRSFFLKNKELYKENHGAFLARAELRFDVRIKNIKEYHSNNSGIKETYNPKVESVDIILTRINNHIKQMEEYRNSSPEIKTLIDELGFGSHKRNSINEIIYRGVDGKLVPYIHSEDSPLEHWHKYKKELKSMIVKYLIATLNPEFNFRQDILEQCNLRCCKLCKEKNSIDELKFDFEITN